MNCPKCGREQNPADSCLYCGIVFAKYHEIRERELKGPDTPNSATDLEENPPTRAESSSHEDVATGSGIFARLAQTSALPWNPVSTPAMAVLSAGFAIMVYLLATKDMLGAGSTVLYLVHTVNLVFHEAGHWIFGIFGNEMLAIFGGSLNQVLIPLIVAISFWLKRDTVGFAFGLFWCFENLLDVAVYMADARALVLPLLGGLGDDAHDWRNLFFRFGLIDQDTAIAGATSAVGWTGICCTWLWFLWRWFAGRKNLPS